MTLLKGLPAIDPAEAELRRVVVAALTGLEVAGVPLAASVPAVRDFGGAWLRLGNGAALTVDRLEGVPVRLDADDALRAAALVERAEPLVGAIEAALGIALDPVDLGEAPADAVIFAVEQGGAARLRLALPSAIAILPRPAPFAATLAAGIVLGAVLRLAGPRVAPHDAAGLAAGDLLLLGSGPLPARLAVAGTDLTGRFDPAARQFRIHSTGVS